MACERGLTANKTTISTAARPTRRTFQNLLNRFDSPFTGEDQCMVIGRLHDSGHQRRQFENIREDKLGVSPPVHPD